MILTLINAIAALSSDPYVLECGKRIDVTTFNISYKIEQCFFRSFTYQQDGGAVFVSNQLSCISQTSVTFEECFSSDGNGGAEYISVIELGSQSISGSQCASAIDGQFAYISSKNTTMDSLSISRCGCSKYTSNTATLKLCHTDNKVNLGSNNITSNYVSKSVSAIQYYLITRHLTKHSVIGNNSAHSICCYIAFTGDGQTYRCEFLNNTQSSSELGTIYLEKGAHERILNCTFTGYTDAYLFSSLPDCMIEVLDSYVKFESYKLASGNVTFSLDTIITLKSTPTKYQSASLPSYAWALISVACASVIAVVAVLVVKSMNKKLRNPLIEALLLQHEIDKDFG